MEMRILNFFMPWLLRDSGEMSLAKFWIAVVQWSLAMLQRVLTSFKSLEEGWVLLWILLCSLISSLWSSPAMIWRACAFLSVRMRLMPSSLISLQIRPLGQMDSIASFLRKLGILLGRIFISCALTSIPTLLISRALMLLTSLLCQRKTIQKLLMTLGPSPFLIPHLKSLPSFWPIGFKFMPFR